MHGTIISDKKSTNLQKSNVQKYAVFFLLAASSIYGGKVCRRLENQTHKLLIKFNISITDSCFVKYQYQY